MKNNTLLKCISGAAILGIVGVSAIALSSNAKPARALDANQYYHYTGIKATCEADGVTDYYTNCYDSTVSTLPEGATVIAERQATAADVAYIKSRNPSDSRLIPALGHDFDEKDYVCKHTANKNLVEEAYDLYTGHATKGNATLTETANTYEGFEKIYQYKHTYNGGSAYYISQTFTDIDITNFASLRFYINTNGSAFFFGGDDDTHATSYQMSSDAAFEGTEGVITATNKGQGTWLVESTGFKFRTMKNAAATNSFTFNNRTTLNQLFHNYQTWGANTILVSEVQVVEIQKCGASKVTGRAIYNPTKWTVSGDAGNLGNLYDASGAIMYQVADFSLDGYTEIKFRVKNNDTGNGFICKGNFSNAKGGIYSGKDETIIATKTGDDWVVTMESGHKFFELPSWSESTSYTIAGATKFADLFYFTTSSTDIEISDFIAKGTPTVDRYNITEKALPTYTSDPSKGNAVLTDQGSLIGFGRKYEYKTTYNGGTLYPQKTYFSDYDISNCKTIEFWIYLANGGEVVWAADDGTTTDAYTLHAGAGAQNPGVIRATQTEAGTWNVWGYDINFRNITSGSQVTNFTYTGRTTLSGLFGRTDASNGLSTANIQISDIYVTK